MAGDKLDIQSTGDGLNNCDELTVKPLYTTTLYSYGK